VKKLQTDVATSNMFDEMPDMQRFDLFAVAFFLYVCSSESTHVRPPMRTPTRDRRRGRKRALVAQMDEDKFAAGKTIQDKKIGFCIA
jgi:hypothetical protein